MYDGFINVLKPPGMSSHDIVSFIRRVYGMKKVGHAGTLDPAAAGVLPVALGKATRLIEYITDADKSYRAELTFGYETDTGDDTGKIIRTSDGIVPDESKVNYTLQSFLGEVSQKPPMYSAIKVQGEKLCDLARKGISIDVPSRVVNIKSIALILYEHSKIVYDVECSKGTYIRTLCADIGKKLNIPSVMSFLVRTRVGGFLLAEAYTLDEIANYPEQVLKNMDAVLTHMPALNLEKNEILAFKQGQKVYLGNGDWMPTTSSIIRVCDDQGDFIGIGNCNTSNHRITPIKVISR